MGRHPLIMGVVNVTPDSFSDGGSFFSPAAAVEQVLQLFRDGADIVDIGAESSRPGATFLTVDEEWGRLSPVLTMLEKRGCSGVLSIDTNKPAIMERVVDRGVQYINDIRGGTEEGILRHLAQKGIGYIAMHMHERPEIMQRQPLDAAEALVHVEQFYRETHQRLLCCGFPAKKIYLDPGICFGKTDAANMQLMAQAMNAARRFNILLGISRKSFLGRLMDRPVPLERDDVSKGLELGFMMGGIQMIRTHNVKPLVKMRQLLRSEG